MKTTALAQLVELLGECKGITATPELVEATGYSDRAIRKAKAELRCRNYSAARNPGAGTPVPNGTRVPDSHTCARAYKELPSEVVTLKKDIPPVGPPKSEPKKSKRKSPARPLPEDWVIPDDWVAKAESKFKLSAKVITQQAEQFHRNALQNDRRCVRWEMAFGNWIGKGLAEGWIKSAARKPQSNGVDDANRRALQEILGNGDVDGEAEQASNRTKFTQPGQTQDDLSPMLI
jgi:hypothetical protein